MRDMRECEDGEIETDRGSGAVMMDMVLLIDLAERMEKTKLKKKQ